MPARLALVDLDQTALTGQRRFISCWVHRRPDLTYIVDPGPTSTADVLLDRLAALGVERLDAVLLTHIHLDHGGATAAVLERHPEARVLCHPRGRPHLVAPERLWEGSRQVLGAVAEAYGQPGAVPEGALAGAGELAARGIEVLETPGHAAHHLAFLDGGTLFAGEAAGTFLELEDGGWYQRPATPPRFVLEVALSSLDRLLAVAPRVERVAFAHHGLLAGRADEVLARARAQLEHWVATARAVAADRPGAAFDALADDACERLRASDPQLARQGELPADIRQRERQYMRQSLRGIFGYVGAV